MQSRFYLAFSVLCIFSRLSHELSCNDRQYNWKSSGREACCDRCPPGQYMMRRSSSSCYIECKPCHGPRYTDKYNVAMSCDICHRCNHLSMELVSNCNATHNTVCKCKAGYTCSDKECKECVLIPTPSPSTTDAVVSHQPHHNTTAVQSCRTEGAADMSAVVLTTLLPDKPIKDAVWFLVIIGLLCGGIALVIVTKIKPFLHWVTSYPGYFLVGKDTTQPPVQEVCGKCDQHIEV
ncbi:uncharacterized protein KZ484_026462 [Pholidichthys leucotaenia]